jgi:hypothetical protein
MSSLGVLTTKPLQRHPGPANEMKNQTPKPLLVPISELVTLLSDCEAILRAIYHNPIATTRLPQPT